MKDAIMRVLAFTPGPPSRSDALIQQLAAYLRDNGHTVGLRYFGAYHLPTEPGRKSSQYEPADAVITIGWNDNIYQIHSDMRADNRVTYAISDGFLRRGWTEGAYFAATRNGLHAYGDRVTMMPGDRWKKLGCKLMPWREPAGKDYILVAHQHTSAYDGADRQPYFIETINLLRKEFPEKTIILRPHPRDKKLQLLPNCLLSRRPLLEDLLGAWAVVTYDSNIAVDAVLFGIPVFTRGATMADPIACKDFSQIKNPPMPDRQQWAHDLAYAQWTVTELRAGLPWVHLIDGWAQKQASGLVDQVAVAAKEEDFEYEHDPEALLSELTDWNVKPGQTPEQVVQEIINPVHSDKIKVRKSKFQGMNEKQLLLEAEKYGITIDIRNKKQTIDRLIHATL